MNSNRYYDAMLEGRYRPTVELETLKDGTFRAYWKSGNGHEVEFVDENPTYAQNQLNHLIREAVKNGDAVPF